MSHTAITLLESYIKGKDDDQFQILEEIYSQNAELDFEIAADTISFPAKTMGNQAIAKVLSKDFNKKYQKVKTYYVSTPNADQLAIHQQRWLVVMQDKSDLSTRVGTGYYNWHLFETERGLKIEKHKIYIHVMLTLIDEDSTELNRIQSTLRYPWLEPQNIINALSINPAFEVIIDYLDS